MKYGIQRRCWCWEEARGPYKVSLSRNIRNGWGSFSNFVSYKVGESSHIRFWYYLWCKEGALKYSFSEFYSIDCNKGASLVSDYLDLSNCPIHWNPSFSLGQPMIGNWNLLTTFLTYYTPRKLIQEKWIVYCRHHLAAMALQWSAIIKCYIQVSIIHSLRKVFGRLRPLLALLSPYGQQQRVESSWWITLQGKVSI